MEDKSLNINNKTENFMNFVKEKKKLLIYIITIVILLVLAIFYFNYLTEKNNLIAEKYIKAGIFLAAKDTEKSKNIYKEIILSKNKFYSLLALNNLIENNLEENSNEVLSLFETVEKISIDKDQKDLIKLKKSLYLLKISMNKEAEILLNEIISSNSLWKDTALEILK